jgi:hypothetical protein
MFSNPHGLVLGAHFSRPSSVNLVNPLHHVAVVWIDHIGCILNRNRGVMT